LRRQAEGIRSREVWKAHPWRVPRTRGSDRVREDQRRNQAGFSPQNWIKTKTCLAGIRAAIQQYFTMLPSMPGGKELNQKLKAAMAMDAGQFEQRWAAD